MNNIKKQLGSKIKEIRKKRGLTQERLAELVGIGTPNISYIESGKFAPAIDTLDRISKALQVEPYELYKFENKSNEDIKKELFQALEEDNKLLRIIYNFFLSIRFLLRD